ncbi:hypothetical protein GE061_005154, partial [Apolygus lucorum]
MSRRRNQREFEDVARQPVDNGEDRMQRKLDFGVKFFDPNTCHRGFLADHTFRSYVFDHSRGHYWGIMISSSVFIFAWAAVITSGRAQSNDVELNDAIQGLVDSFGDSLFQIPSPFT